MELILQRVRDTGEETLGYLTNPEPGSSGFWCFTLEDQHRDVKVHSDTRIPAGRYEVKLRLVGAMHTKYASKFGKMHKGMLEIVGIPNYTAVMFHIGNSEQDTAGCPLVGNTAVIAGKRVTLGDSTACYKRIYPIVAGELVAGRKVWLTVKDEK